MSGRGLGSKSLGLKPKGRRHFAFLRPQIQQQTDRHLVINGCVYDYRGVELPFPKPTPEDFDRTQAWLDIPGWTWVKEPLFGRPDRVIFLRKLKFVGELTRQFSWKDVEDYPGWIVIQGHVYDCPDWDASQGQDFTSIFESLDPEARLKLSQQLKPKYLGMLRSAPPADALDQYVDHSVGIQCVFQSLDVPPALASRFLLTPDVLSLLSGVVTDVVHWIAKLIATLEDHKRTRTVSSRAVQSSILCLPISDALRKRCKFEGFNRVTNYIGGHEVPFLGLSVAALDMLLSSTPKAAYEKLLRHTDSAAIYLAGAMEVLISHILEDSMQQLEDGQDILPVIMKVVTRCFQGMPLPQTRSVFGGISEHTSEAALQRFVTLLGPGNMRLFQDDLHVRQQFLIVPLPDAISAPFATLVDPWSPVDPALYRASGLKLLLGDAQALQFRLVECVADFKKRLVKHTSGLLDDDFFAAPGLYLAGGSVLRCLLAEPKGFVGSDYDIFFTNGLSPGEADKLLERSVNLLTQKAKVLGAVSTVRRSDYALSVDIHWGIVHVIVQFVARIYRTPAEVLTGFDLDACSVGFDGTKVFGTPRFLRALATRANYIDLTRRSLTYEYRLWKYSRRGFAVFCPVPDGFEEVVQNWNVDDARASCGLGRLLSYHVGLLPVSGRDRHPSDYASLSLAQTELRGRQHEATTDHRLKWITKNPGSQSHLVGSFHPLPAALWDVNVHSPPSSRPVEGEDSPEPVLNSEKRGAIDPPHPNRCKEVQDLRLRGAKLRELHISVARKSSLLQPFAEISLERRVALLREMYNKLAILESQLDNVSARDSLREELLALSQGFVDSCELSLTRRLFHPRGVTGCPLGGESPCCFPVYFNRDRGAVFCANRGIEARNQRCNVPCAGSKKINHGAASGN